MTPRSPANLCIVYLAEPDKDDALEINVMPSNNLERAIAMARERIAALEFAAARAADPVPAGFAIENSQGDEIYRWLR